METDEMPRKGYRKGQAADIEVSFRVVAKEFRSKQEVDDFITRLIHFRDLTWPSDGFDQPPKVVTDASQPYEGRAFSHI